MTNNGNPRPLAAIVGERLRLFREEKNLRQEDVAEAARFFGAEWGRSSVAALEGGKRDLRLEELIILSSVVHRLGGWSEPLIPRDAKFRITDKAHSYVGEAFAALYRLTSPSRVRESSGEDTDVMKLGEIESNPPVDGFTKLQSVARNVIVYDRIRWTLWPNAGAGKRTIGTSGELGFRMAERIRWPDTGEPITVQLMEVLALAAWGRFPAEERDARTDVRGTYETKRALQSARGHVTRELIDELQEVLGSRYLEIRRIIDDLESVIDDERALKKWRDESYALEDKARRGDVVRSGIFKRGRRRE